MSLPVLLYLRYFFDCFAMFMITKTKHSEARCLFVRLWVQYLSLSPFLPSPSTSTVPVRHRSDYQTATLNQDPVVQNQTKGSA